MRLNRPQSYIVLLAILTLLIAVFTNVATAQLPKSVTPYLWWSWPILGVLAVIFVIVTLKTNWKESSSPSAEFSLKRYYDALRKRYQILDLDALTPPQKEEYLQIHLRSVFVEQHVREDPPPIELPKEIIEKLQSKGDVDLRDLPEGLTEEELRAVGQKYFESPLQLVLDALVNPKNRLA